MKELFHRTAFQQRKILSRWLGSDGGIDRTELLAGELLIRSKCLDYQRRDVSAVDRSCGENILCEHGLPCGGLRPQTSGSDDGPVEIGVQPEVPLSLVLLNQRLLQDRIGLLGYCRLRWATANAEKILRVR